MTAQAVPYGRSTQKQPAVAEVQLSGSQPAWVATAIRFPSPPQPSPALKTSCWARFRVFLKFICTIQYLAYETGDDFLKAILPGRRRQAGSFRPGGRRVHS